MASKEVWAHYNSGNPNKGSDEDIVSMLEDTVATFKNLVKMYDYHCDLVLHGIIDTYRGLQEIAIARGIKEYPRLA